MRDYKKLEVWKKAHEVYMYVKRNIVSKFPKEERYELASQLSRAALSIPLNVVEGCGRYTGKDFTHFLDNSLGSTNETDYCCYAAFELKYISEEEYNIVNKQVNEVRAMLISFIKFLRNEK
jgi:four helix bundle protein